MVLDNIKIGISEFVQENPLTSAAILGGSVIAVGGATTLAVRRKRKVTKRKKNGTRKRKTRKRTTKRKSKGRRTPRTAGKGKDRSTKRIRYTKKGQPYVITRSGKAKFIKKSSAKRSHKIKGGRY